LSQRDISYPGSEVLFEQVVLHSFVWPYGDGWNGYQSVAKTLDLGEEVLPAMQLTPQHARTVRSGPVVVLKDSFWQIDSILKCQDCRQKRRATICLRHVEIGIHADLDPDAGRISLAAPAVPADLVGRQALIDTRVVDREVPGYLALAGTTTLLILRMR